MGKSNRREWLRDRRRSLGLSQAEMGDRMGVSESRISAWERGLGDVRLRNQRDLAEHYQMPLGVVLDLFRDERGSTSINEHSKVAYATRELARNNSALIGVSATADLIVALEATSRSLEALRSHLLEDALPLQVGDTIPTR